MIDYGLTTQISEALVEYGYDTTELLVYAAEAAIAEERLPEYIEVRLGNRTDPRGVVFGRFRLRVNDDYPGPTIYENRRTGATLEVIF